MRRFRTGRNGAKKADLRCPGVSPFFLFPGEVFTRIPYAPTLEGRYIIKNIVLIAAGIVVGATVRGGRVVAEPEGPGAE